MSPNLSLSLGATSQPLLGPGPWSFPAGAGFGAPNLWWGEKKARRRPHEGLDFLPAPGQMAAETVHLLAAGELVAVEPDFLGHSLWVRHRPTGGAPGRRLYSVYAHLQPRPALAVGEKLAAGDAVGTIAFPPNQGGVPAHLHLSLAWLPDALPPSQLRWETIHRHGPALFFDPLPWLLAMGLKLSPPPRE